MQADTTPTIRSISYGGGVQSTALLALAAQGRIDFRTFLMANVGDDSENPATLRYLDEYARPFAAEHDIDHWRSRCGCRTGPPAPARAPPTSKSR